MKFYFKIILFIITLISLQTKLIGQITPVSNTILNDEIDGFQFLETELENVRLLGIGEGTHGTEEFKIIQCNLFKYLVVNHGYNTFFLEDEYLYCLPIDEYIKGGEGNVDSLVTNLRNWPWKTPYIKSLILWMKEYNELNNNALSFVGVDFQNQDDFFQYLDTELGIETTGLDLEGVIKSFRTLEDKSIVALFEKSLVEWDDNSGRDVAMAELMLQYLEIYSDSKAVYCAHNAHVLKIYNEKKDHYYAGGILDNKLKEKYYALVTDFDTGKFYAHTLKDPSLDRNKFEDHKFIINKAVCQNERFSLCKYLNNQDSEIMFISNLQNIKKLRKGLNINIIGATYYGSEKDSTKHNSPSYIPSRLIDGVLFFKTTEAAVITK